MLEGKRGSFVKEMLSTIVGANHFCRMLCDYGPQIFKVPLISLLIWACAFYGVFFLSKCNTIFKVPYIRLETAYTFLLGLGLEIAAVRLFLCISASVMKAFVTC